MIVSNMVDAEGARETQHPSGQMVSFPRDLLRRFTHGRNNFPEKIEARKEGDEEEDIELSLGLSLNGRFGVDPEREKNLIRSSSISNLTMKSSEEESRVVFLTRTCSLPMETEEDWRKRKELQSHRRMEAKRKRLEKMKNVRVVREKIDSEEIYEEKGRGGGGLVPIRNGELSTPVMAESKGEGFQTPQASIASQGSGSSGVSDFESQPTPASAPAPETNQSAKARSPARVQALPPRVEQKPVLTPRQAINKPVGHKEGNELVKSMMVDMPCVSTKGNGPNGKRIEGFLYRYRKGEEVKIVCVCHGSFLSPAEFIKHAGGGDVAHPLRHIVVCTSPSPFL